MGFLTDTYFDFALRRESARSNFGGISVNPQVVISALGRPLVYSLDLENLVLQGLRMTLLGPELAARETYPLWCFDQETGSYDFLEHTRDQFLIVAAALNNVVIANQRANYRKRQELLLLINAASTEADMAGIEAKIAELEAIPDPSFWQTVP